MGSVNFVLETSWAWDHHHNNFATYCMETYGAEDELAKLEKTHIPSKSLMRKLEELCDAQDGSVQGRADMVCLYMMESRDRATEENGMVTFSMKLRPICRFDDMRKPIPVW